MRIWTTTPFKLRYKILVCVDRFDQAVFFSLN